MSDPQWALGHPDQAARSFVPGSECPCGCGETGSKLSVRTGHIARGCKCRPCDGRRSRKKGQAAQSRALKDAARAQGIVMEIAPTHEEQARLLVHYEVKSGQQVAKANRAKVEEWAAQARSFAHRQVPARKWALVLDYPGTSTRRIVMDFDEFLSLVAELGSV